MRMVLIKALTNYKAYPITIFFSIILLITTFFALVPIAETQISEQAFSWTKGHLDQVGHINTVDTIKVNGKYYWTGGPFPTILCLPIVFVSELTKGFLNSESYSFKYPYLYKYAQNIVNYILVLATLCLSFKISKKLNYSDNDSLFLSVALLFGSVFCQTIFNAGSWALPLTVVTFLLTWALYIFISSGHYLLIGLLLSFALATRPTAALSVLFFIFGILFSKDTIKSKTINMVLLLTPMIISFLMLMQYNYVRFNNYFDTGYGAIGEQKYFKLADVYYEQKLPHRLFSLENIPRNFSIYFFGYPNIGVYGMNVSIFLTCLPFIFIVLTNVKNKYALYATITSSIILLVLLSYYWAGWRQIGPRYLLDLLPLWYLMLLYSFKDYKLSRLAKTLIIVGSIGNVILNAATGLGL